MTKEEFTDGYARLEAVQFLIERDLDESWRHFQGWRINYESIVDVLTRLVMPPPAPWFLSRPALGKAEWPTVRNRTPDDPEGAKPFWSTMTLKRSTLGEPAGRREGDQGSP